VAEVDAFDALYRTQADRLRTPPLDIIATGHDDSAYLWLTRITDAGSTANVLSGLIAVGEATMVAERFVATGGLLAKRLSVDDALAARERLAKFGTEAVLVRPDDADRLPRRSDDQ